MTRYSNYKYFILIFGLFLLAGGFATCYSQEDVIKTLQNKLENKSDFEKIKILNLLSEKNIDTNIDSARFYNKKALELSELVNSRLGKAKSNYIISKINYKDRKYVLAIEHALLASVVFKEHNLKLDLGSLHNLIGRSFEATGNLKKAFKYFYLSDLTFQKTDSISSYKIWNLNDLANIYISKDNYVSALECLNKAQKLSSNEKYDRQLADTYIVFSYLHYSQLEYENSLKYSNLALAIYQKQANTKGKVSCQINNANIYYSMGDYRKAFIISDSIYKSSTNLNYYARYNSSLLISKSLLQLENSSRAMDYCSVSEELANTLNNNRLRAEVLLQKSKILFKNGNAEGAVIVLKKCINISKKEELPYLKREAILELSTIYEKIGNMDKSYFYYKQYVSQKDSLYQNQKNDQIEFLKNSFEIKNIQSELKRKNELLITHIQKEKMVSRYNTFLLIGGFIILVLSIISFIIQRKLIISRKISLKLERKHSNYKIDFKNKQITDFALHISKKNELLENINKKVKSLPYKNKEEKQIINDIKNCILNDIQQNKEKVQLYSKIQETQNSFLHILSVSFPMLTNTEKKVALLLRMDLTSKQMASQLGLSITSIDTYRSRIRTKLKIPKNQKLSNFIKEIKDK